MSAIFAECLGVHGRAVVRDELDAFDVDPSQILRDELIAALDQISGCSARHRFNPAAVGEAAYKSKRARVAVVRLSVYLFYIACYPSGWSDCSWHRIMAVGRSFCFAEWAYAAIHRRLDAQPL
jgi:hypothetical protein